MLPKSLVKVVATGLVVKDKLVRRVDLYMDKGDVIRKRISNEFSNSSGAIST